MKFRPPFMVQTSLKHQEKPSEYFIYSPLLHIITNRPPCRYYLTNHRYSGLSPDQMQYLKSFVEKRGRRRSSFRGWSGLKDPYDPRWVLLRLLRLATSVATSALKLGTFNDSCKNFNNRGIFTNQAKSRKVVKGSALEQSWYVVSPVAALASLFSVFLQIHM